MLADRGHKLDAQPMAMAAELSALELPEARDLDWFETRETALIGSLNDAAYGLTGAAFRSALGRLDDARWRGYAARHEGEPVACLLCWDGDYGDCAIAAVATLPAARSRGYATRLLAQALRDARERGCVSTSLQSSSKGLPIYAALGYRPLGRMGMWELRTP
jgi:GNAT superfamily N-acetyltransferase